MILGFRDLIGDMGGVNIPGEIGPSGTGSQAGAGPMVHGDMLRASANADGTFTLESGGRVDDLVSNGQMPGAFNPMSGTFAASSVNWGYGPGVGPGGGYFYNPRPLSTHDTILFQIPHPYQGGLIQIPGFADVVATSIHIRAAQENGLLWRDNKDGETKAALQNQVTPVPSPTAPQAFSGFAKSNGLGDIAAYTGVASQAVQIGNRLWYDRPHSGIQEPNEPPVTDTLVELFDCAGNAVDSTHTDSHGEYAFNIEPGECYTVRVPLDQPSLHGWVPTRAFVGTDRRIDSNGVRQGAFVVAHVTPKAAGENDFTYDFGFFKPSTPPPPPAPPPPPTPHHELIVIKKLLSQSGRTVRWEIIVRNGGPDLILNARVCDTLPAGFEFVSVNAPGHTSSGRQVCWNIASLPSGSQHTYTLTTRVRAGTLTGTAENCVDARGTTAAGPNAPVGPVGPVRDCASVHGKAPPPPRPPSFTG